MDYKFSRKIELPEREGGKIQQGHPMAGTIAMRTPAETGIPYDHPLQHAETTSAQFLQSRKDQIMAKVVTRIYICSDPHCRTVIEKRDPVQRSRRCPDCGKTMYYKGKRETEK